MGDEVLLRTLLPDDIVRHGVLEDLFDEIICRASVRARYILPGSFPSELMQRFQLHPQSLNP